MSGDLRQCALCGANFITFSQKNICPDCRQRGLETPTGAAVSAMAAAARSRERASVQEDGGAKPLPKFWA